MWRCYNTRAFFLVCEGKYAFSDIYNYVANKTYHKRGLRKRNKYFSADGGKLYFLEDGNERRIMGSRLIWTETKRCLKSPDILACASQ